MSGRKFRILPVGTPQQKPQVQQPAKPQNTEVKTGIDKILAKARVMGNDLATEICVPTKSHTDYHRYFRENCTYLDSKTFPAVKNQVFKYLKDPLCPSDVKILLGDWLFRKIHLYYKPQDAQRDELCDSLKGATRSCKNFIAKGQYLKYLNTQAVYNIASHFYLERFEEKELFFIIQMLNDVELMKNITQNPDIDSDEMRNHFLNWIKKVPTQEQRSNLLDVLLRYYPGDGDVRKINENMKWGDTKNFNKTIYSNDQNAHDEEISEEVMLVAEKLLLWNKEHETEIPESLKTSIEKCLKPYIRGNRKQILETVLARASVDTTTFGKSGFMIFDILYSLIQYINNRKSDKDVLIDILFDEMDNMKGLCSSGYIARLMNVLQGFDENFFIKISFSQQLQASLSVKLAKGMEGANEKIIYGVVDEKHRKYYLDFLCDMVNLNLQSLIETYGRKDVESNIVKVVENLAGNIPLCTWKYESESTKMSYEYTGSEDENAEESLEKIEKNEDS